MAWSAPIHACIPCRTKPTLHFMGQRRPRCSSGRVMPLASSGLRVSASTVSPGTIPFAGGTGCGSGLYRPLGRARADGAGRKCERDRRPAVVSGESRVQLREWCQHRGGRRLDCVVNELPVFPVNQGRIAFRTDASLQIGTGHVMRCLTLANALRSEGAHCVFVCRAHPGHLGDKILAAGHALLLLPPGSDSVAMSSKGEDYASWLGCNWEQDASETVAALGDQKFDWLVVDHYALDANWEDRMRGNTDRIMAIDDLANRPHQADLLLDQTYRRNSGDYRDLVPVGCDLLCGSRYALLRPEFAELRSYSLQRRDRPVLREVLVTMGGVDKDNATGQVLDALRTSSLHPDCRITVVMGESAPWLDKVRNQAQDMPWPTRVMVGVTNMAQLMADSDLALGAAGATSWERCCLGLPTIMLPLAENQSNGCRELDAAGAGVMVSIEKPWEPQISRVIQEYRSHPASMVGVAIRSSAVTDGRGASKVVGCLMHTLFDSREGI